MLYVIVNNKTDNKVKVKLLGGDLLIEYSKEENTVYNVEDVVKDRDTSDIIELLLSHEFCNGNLYKKHKGLKLDSEVAIKRFCEESD